MSMGIYDQMIGFFTAQRRSSLREGRSLLPYGIGVMLGVLVFSYLIEYLQALFPLQMAGIFVGLILGALPMLLRQVKGHRIALSHIFILFCTILILVLMPVLSENPGSAYSLSPTLPHALLAVGLGFAGAATMVIPGVSGSMLLLILGCYDSMLQYTNAFTRSLFHLDGAGMLQSLIILAPFAIGALFGIILTCRFIKALLKRYPLSTYYGIIGLVVASPFAVLYQHDFSGLRFGGGLAVLLCAAAGFFIAAWLGRKEE